MAKDQGKKDVSKEVAKDYAIEVESRKAEIGTSLSRMQELKGEFTAGLQPFVQKWFQTIARQYIQRNPEKALKLGKEKLAQLKSRVKKLCDDVETICKEFFANDDFWPETRELISKNQLGVKMVLGKLGTLLEEFELVKSRSQTENDQESWNQYDGTGNRREFDGTPVYPHSIELPGELKALLEEYRNLILRKQTLFEEIKNLEFEKLQTEATVLWDSI